MGVNNSISNDFTAGTTLVAASALRDGHKGRPKTGYFLSRREDSEGGHNETSCVVRDA
jgi:hypothetical protein